MNRKVYVYVYYPESNMLRGIKMLADSHKGGFRGKIGNMEIGEYGE